MRPLIHSGAAAGLFGIAGALLLVGLCPSAGAQSLPASGTRAVATNESGPRWQDLSAAQRSTLKPLERDWSSIDASSKQKWQEIAARYPNLPPAEQQRISTRMTEWVKLSPRERGQARLNFQASRQLTPEERQARWQAYQSLTPEQRGKLAERAAPAGPAVPRGNEGARKPTAAPRDGVQAKSNIVPNPSFAAPPRAVAPTVVQAAPGATTSLMSKRSNAPPTYQQPGLPKIAASPGFVDKQTLLPQRGPQGAAVAPPASKKSDRR